MPTRCFPFLFALLLVATRTWAQAGNDNFALRIPLTGSSVTAVSNLQAATHEAGEPNHANNGGTRSLWWTWTAPSTGMVNFSTFGGGTTPSRAYNTAYTRVLAVYTGNALTSLSEVASVGTLNTYPQTNNAPAGPSCNVSVTAGTTYQIAVDGPAILDPSDDGTAVLAINQAPTLYSAAGASGTVGGSFTYAILASNNPTSFTAPDLPPSLSINPTTGNITGTLPAVGTYTIHLAATNPGGTGTGILTLVVSAANTTSPAAPVITSPAAAAGCVGVAFNYGYSIGNVASVTADGLPPGVTIETTSGVIYGTPTQAGVYNVKLTATNAAGVGTATLVFNIASVPVRPIINSALSVVGTVGGSLSYSVSVADTSAAGKPSVYAATNLPPGLGFDPNSGVLQGAPIQAGQWSVPISAANAGGTGNAVVTVIVTSPAVTATTPTSAPPVLTSGAAASGTLGSAFNYRLVASNAPTSYAAGSLPPGLSLNSASGYLTGVPTAAGVYQVSVAATNVYGTSNATLTINILATAQTSTASPPVVIASAAEAVGYVGSTLSYQVLASPAQYPYPYYPYGSSSATYAASGLPPGLSINSTYGSIYGTPTTAGSYAATVTVTPATSASPPASAGSATVTFLIASGKAPGPTVAPVFTSQAELALNTGTTYSAISFATASNNPTSYTAGSLPSALTFNTSNGTLSGTPTQAGTYSVPVTATNAAGTGTATLTLFVSAPAAASAPGLTSAATAAGSVGTAFTYNVITNYSATSYSAGSLPPGLSQSASTISGTPTQAGVYAVPISVSNAGGTTTGTLTITIAPGPSAPVISSYAATRGTLGQSFSYAISASNTPTGYTASNLPPGLSLGATGGTISGTPTATGVWNVPITATNATGTGTGNVTITVTSPGAPAFSCVAAASGTVGSTFSFNLYAAPYVTGYTASSLPPGLSITAANGSISGTPTQAGVYNVPVTATNAGGTTGATLTITINPASASVPVISSAAASVGTVGAAFSYTITASNSPTSFDLGASLPPGLNFTPATGTISGSPTTAGTYTLPVSATNSGGTGQATVTLIFAAQPTAVPVITSPAEFAAYSSDSVYYPVTATNSPTSYAASGLPSGLSINPATGVITGVLAGSPTATFPVVVTATNSVGQGSATVVVVNCGGAAGRLTSPLSANGVVNTAFSYSVTTNYSSSSSFTATNLPPGLSLNASTGLISGTPTSTGTYTATLSGSAPNIPATGKVVFNITATASSLPVLTSPAGINAVVGDACYQFLTFGNNPASVSVTNLPVGLSYDSTRALITGSPTTLGTYTVGVSATNSAGTTTGSLTVATTPYYTPAKIISAAGASALLGAPFTYTAATDEPTTYGLTATNLPPGLSCNYSTLKITGTPTTTGVYNCTLTASTSQGQAMSYLTIVVGNGAAAPPVIASAAAAGGPAGAAFSYALAATGSPTSYTASGLPAGLSLDPVAGTISGTPTAAGTFNVPVTAMNAAGTGNATLTFLIAAVAPSLNTASLEISATVGIPAYVYRIPATNGANGYTASGLPPGLSLDPVSGVISGTPTATGLYQTTINASNANGSTGAVIDLLIKDSASAPVFSPFAANLAGAVGASFSQTLSASGGGTITYAASGLPPGLYLNNTTGQLFGAPTQAGTYAVALSATNVAGSDNATLTFLVAAAPALPTFSSSDALSVSASVGGSLFTGINCTNAVTCTASGLPPGANYSFSAGSGTLRGTLTAAGVYPVTFTATNVTGSSRAVVTLVISGNPPAAPVITSAAGATGTVGVVFTYSIYPYLSGGNATPTSYGASGLPDGLGVNAVTGAITGTPTTAGTYPVTMTATNAGGTGSAVVTVRIDSAPATANAAPVITSAASTYYTYTTSSYYYPPNSGFSYAITATSTPTSYAASGLPPGLALNPATGTISGLPLTAGNFNVVISATNAAGTGSATLKIMAPAALPPLSAPLIINGTLGSGLTYAVSPYSSYYIAGYPTLTEPTTFAASNLPPGLSFNAATGIITGTPSQAGTFATGISATDRAGTTAAVLTFVVAAGPAASTTGVAPVLTSAAVVPGFVGVPLSASLSGGTSYASGSLPAGLGLDPSTGNITGTPTAAGVYAVPVTASNAFGTGSATLTFDIAAAAPLPPLITSSAGASATVGSAFGYAIYTSAAAGTVYPATGYSASSLPPGLSLSADGYISGTPTQAGVYTIPIAASAGGATDNATLTLDVLPASALPSTPVSSGPGGTLGFVGEPFNLSLASTGFVLNSTLPAGLTYNAASGVLTGSPTTAGNFNLSFSASGTNGGADGQSVVNLQIVAPDLSLPRVLSQPAGGTVPEGTGFALNAAVSGAPAPSLQWLRDGNVVPGATSAVLSLAAAQPTDAGTYLLVATNSSGRAVSADSLLIVTQTYGDWQTANFTSAEIAAGFAADGYDFNGDGLPNLLEYAFDRNPVTGQGGIAPIGTRGATGALQLQFTRDTGKTDLTYTVEASSDLLNWTAIAGSAAGGPTTNLGGAGIVSESAPIGGVVTVIVTDGQGAGSARFLRLRVARQ